MLRTFALGGLLALAAASAADAHPSFEQPEAVQGATVKFVLRIPHGCDGQATLKLAITIP